SEQKLRPFRACSDSSFIRTSPRTGAAPLPSGGRLRGIFWGKSTVRDAHGGVAGDNPRSRAVLRDWRPGATVRYHRAAALPSGSDRIRFVDHPFPPPEFGTVVRHYVLL